MTQATHATTSKNRKVWLAVTALIALQAAVLGWMVWNNESTLASGREIILDVEPVDPRSLFRGDYVILSYTGLSRVEPPVFQATPISDDGKTKLKPGDPMAVIIEQDGSQKSWKPVQTIATCPILETSNKACLQGTIKYVRQTLKNPYVSINYGWENYFVPEGHGRELEKAIEIKSMQVIIALNQHGRGLIKGLIVDGKTVSQEGLF